MMSVCPVCGKYHCIHWPEHWVYRRGETYYCSAMCMDVDIVRDMNILKQVREDRRKRKEAKKMEKMKKDGTPAKKPGPKPKDGAAQVKFEDVKKSIMDMPQVKVDGALRIETPEADMIEIVETPEKPKSPIKTYKVTGIRVENFGEFYYDQKFNSIDWRTIEGDEVSMGPAWWKQLISDLPKIMKLLGVDP